MKRMGGRNTRRWLGALGMVLVTLRPVSAQSEDPAPTPTFSVDLDGDGVPETLSTRKVREENESEIHQLVVFDRKGLELYRSPADLEPGDPLALGYFPFGTRMPEFAGDIDGDRTIEVLLPQPRSDARSPRYTVLRWDQKTFTQLKEGCLLETPAGSGRFRWSLEQTGSGQWVDQFLPSRDGTIEAVLFESTPQDPMRQGKAILVPVAQGFDRVRWTEPLQAPPSVEEP